MPIQYEILFIVVGLVAGGLAVWLVMAPQVRAAHTRDARLAQLVIKFSHDIRGAVTPALLMAERLEMNADPAVKQAAVVIAEAMERTTEIAKAASAEARSIGGVAKDAQRGR